MGDRARQQLRRTSTKKQYSRKSCFSTSPRLASEDTRFSEREKRDPERSRSAQDEIGLEQRVGGLDEEIGVFELAEHYEVDDDTKVSSIETQSPRPSVDRR